MFLPALPKQPDDYKRCAHCGKSPQITTDEAYQHLIPVMEQNVAVQTKENYEFFTWYYYLLWVLCWLPYCPGPGWICCCCSEKKEKLAGQPYTLS